MADTIRRTNNLEHVSILDLNVVEGDVHRQVAVRVNGRRMAKDVLGVLFHDPTVTLLI